MDVFFTQFDMKWKSIYKIQIHLRPKVKRGFHPTDFYEPRDNRTASRIDFQFPNPSLNLEIIGRYSFSPLSEVRMLLHRFS